jgi:putative transposase
MRLLLSLLVWFLRAVLTSRGSLAVENLALRQQLATYARSQKRPRLKPLERAFWVALSRSWRDWRSPLVLVKPATVIDWHRRGFRRYWRWRSRRPGRPRIPDEHIAFIRRSSTDQPGWGEDRIAEELALKLGVRHSTSTIRRYMVRRREPRGGQTWKTFVNNHARQIFAVDFLTQPSGRRAPQCRSCRSARPGFARHASVKDANRQPRIGSAAHQRRPGSRDHVFAENGW